MKVNFLLFSDVSRVVSFGSMKMYNTSTGELHRIRRLTTMSDVNNTDHTMESVCTDWVWYIQVMGRYIECAMHNMVSFYTTFPGLHVKGNVHTMHDIRS